MKNSIIHEDVEWVADNIIFFSGLKRVDIWQKMKTNVLNDMIEGTPDFKINKVDVLKYQYNEMNGCSKKMILIMPT